jgi:hypothetical protein
MRAKLRAFLTDAVFGAYVRGSMPNGDFAISHADLLAERFDRIERVGPSAA